jgi:hypothetical protein
MCEEIKKDAIELSDEEMDNVSGGKALLIINNYDGTTSYIVKCKHKKISGQELKKNFVGLNDCEHFDARGASLYHTCYNCENRYYYDFKDGNHPDIGNISGYDVVYLR